MKLSLEKTVVGGFVVALLLLGLIGSVAYRSTLKFGADADSVRHSQEVLAHLAALLGTTIDAEIGTRRFELAGSIAPDLILFDIQLPGMDGYAVARAIKGDARLKPIPIVAVTSYAMVGDREKAFASGAQGYIEKPINPETFVSEIESQLKPSGKESAP